MRTNQKIGGQAATHHDMKAAFAQLRAGLRADLHRALWIQGAVIVVMFAAGLLLLR